MHKGWLQIPGVQDGDRSLDEQLLGLGPALAACDRKTVYDFGCAEGLIGIEFAKLGAAKVRGCDLLPTFVAEANRQADLIGLGLTCRFYEYDLRFFLDGLFPEFEPERYDIVLALAIVHKLRDPGAVLARMADVAAQRLVLRLPLGSTGEIRAKHFKGDVCDSREVMPAAGFELEQQLAGPRGELVQHWVRRLS